MRIDELNLDGYKHIKNNDWYGPTNLLKWLKTNGFVKLGKGVYSSAWESSWESKNKKFIVKVNNGINLDTNYLKFIEFCHKHKGNKHLPKIGEPKKYEDWYIVFIEKLDPITSAEIFFGFSQDQSMKKIIQNIVSNNPNSHKEIYELLPENVRKHRNSKQLVEIIFLAILFVNEYGISIGNLDIHINNIMMRDDTTFVLTDPVTDIEENPLNSGFADNLEYSEREQEGRFKNKELNDYLNKNDYVFLEEINNNIFLFASMKKLQMARIEKGETQSSLGKFIDFCKNTKMENLIDIKNFADFPEDNLNCIVYEAKGIRFSSNTIGLTPNGMNSLFKNMVKFKPSSDIDIINTINEEFGYDYEDVNAKFYNQENIKTDNKIYSLFIICKLLSVFAQNYNISDSEIEYKDKDSIAISGDNLILMNPLKNVFGL